MARRRCGPNVERCSFVRLSYCAPHERLFARKHVLVGRPCATLPHLRSLAKFAKREAMRNCRKQRPSSAQARGEIECTNPVNGLTSSLPIGAITRSTASVSERRALAITAWEETQVFLRENHRDEEEHQDENRIQTYPNGCKSSEKILWMTEILNTETHTPVSSHGSSLEPKPARSADLGQHSVETHFPKDLNCEICQRTKITRASCRTRIGSS